MTIISTYFPRLLYPVNGVLVCGAFCNIVVLLGVWHG